MRKSGAELIQKHLCGDGNVCTVILARKLCSDLKSEVFGYHAVPVPHKEVDLVAKEGMRVIDGADTP